MLNIYEVMRFNNNLCDIYVRAIPYNICIINIVMTISHRQGTVKDMFSLYNIEISFI